MFITAAPSTKLFARVCVFITAVPITKLFAYTCVCVLLLQDLLQSCARGGRRRVEDMCYERRRAEACVDESAHHAGVCFITAGPITKAVCVFYYV